MKKKTTVVTIALSWSRSACLVRSPPFGIEMYSNSLVLNEQPTIESLQNVCIGRSHRVEFFNDFQILKDDVGYPMHATFVTEEHQRFNFLKRPLQAGPFFRPPGCNVFVAELNFQIRVGVTFVEQEGQEVGRKEYEDGVLDLESPLHTMGEVVKNVIGEPFRRSQSNGVLNQHLISAKADKYFATI
jgi:hypothetical protein